ncbi:MAG TPA: TonB-dependent receptor, partial [Usitatibacter sp.]|nr:TonB-dependent receptor [Usitatibacter sp.]
SSFWLKAGASDQDSTLDEVLSVVQPGQSISRQSHFAIKPRSNDVALRHTFLSGEKLEVTWGAETARTRTPITLVRDSTLHLAATPSLQESLDQVDHDRSDNVYAIARWQDATLRLELGSAWVDYRKDRDILVSRQAAVGQDVRLMENYRLRKGAPIAGVTWRFAPSALARAACRRWVRPTALDSLAPVAVAGMPLDDQLVLSGGILEQCRAQWEWTQSPSTFIAAFVERSRVHNLVSPLDGVLNAHSDVTNLDRLRNRALSPVPKPDLLEDLPVYGQGIARRVNVAFEQIVTPCVGARIHYTYTDSENTAAGLEGRRIPYLARHQGNFALTWAPGWKTFVTTQAVYRSRRYADEGNTIGLPAGWDAQVNLFVESRDKHWAVEAYGANFFKKETKDLYGIVVSYRF